MSPISIGGGGELNGFPRTKIPDTARRTSIPTISAADVAIGDFNGNKHPDLAFANNTSRERSIYIYWGDGTGNFSQALRQVLPVADPKSAAMQRDIKMQTLLSADLNGDGISDLVAAGNQNAIVFSGSARGLIPERIAEFPAKNCLALAASDLNGDGQVDLIVANAGAWGTLADYKEPPVSVIYWGAKQGFSLDHRTDLPTRGARAVVTADLNQDGFTDLLFGGGNGMGNAMTDPSSQIYYGGPNGFAAYRRQDLQSFGVEGAGVADFNRDGKPDIVLVNHNSGFGILPSAIYWGDKDHFYSSHSLSLLEPGGGGGNSIGDLDDDGFPDLVVLHPPDMHPSVWWGSRSGYSAGNRTLLPLGAADQCYTANIADFDRDGFLDVAVAIVDRSPAYLSTVKPADKVNAKIVIFYGNEDRYQKARTSTLQLSSFLGVESLQMADLNQDGYLDLIFPVCLSPYSEIWWGSARGYDAGNVTKLEANGSAHAVVADLDADGWLDLVLTGSLGKRKSGQPLVGSYGLEGTPQNTEAFIYWGSPEGFKTRNAIDSFNTLDATAADFNRDGWLELVISNHQKNFSHDSGTNIYWGGDQRVTPILVARPYRPSGSILTQWWTRGISTPASMSGTTFRPRSKAPRTPVFPG